MTTLTQRLKEEVIKLSRRVREIESEKAVLQENLRLAKEKVATLETENGSLHSRNQELWTRMKDAEESLKKAHIDLGKQIAISETLERIITQK